MNDRALDRLEAEAAEIIGALKALFLEFDRRLGEVVSAQRLASSEARKEAADVRASLRELVTQAGATTSAQRQALKELRDGWQMHVEENSKSAGAELALTFGEEIAAGLEKKLVGMTEAVERATRRFEWMTTLKWAAGIAVAIVFTIALGVNAFTPQVDGLSDAKVRIALGQLTPCLIGTEHHTCVALDDKPILVKVRSDRTLAVVRGM